MGEFLELGDTRLYINTTGQGRAVILVHGGPAAYDYFHESIIVNWLKERRLVCSYDQRGCRYSTSAGPFTMQANIDDLEQVRRYVSTEAIELIGHSWGGYLALRYAVVYPHRVQKLVLLTPIGAREGWNIDFHRNINARHRGEQLDKLRKLKKDINHCRDRVRRKELYRRQSELAMASYMAEDFRHAAPPVEFFDRELSALTVDSMVASYREPGWEEKLDRITDAVLIIYGAEDPLPAYIVDDLREMLPQAQVARLEGCGHFPWLEKPEALRAVLVPFLWKEDVVQQE
jgi:proline iminopeptidase